MPSPRPRRSRLRTRGRLALQGLLLLGLARPVGAAAVEPTGVDAARAALVRMGVADPRLTLRLVEGTGDVYQVDASRGQAVVRGSSAVALVRGSYAYLNAVGRASINWEGDRIVRAGRLPSFRSGPVRSPFVHRAYLNTCTFGYTTPWWGWRRWSREIDWMAIHGVDMPLAMEGQDYVWRALWREQGLDDAAIAKASSGPAFLPWQRMGNIEGYRAPLQPGWIEKKHQLQRRILGRMRALGMTPILPAFAGYVPKAFADRHPEARIYRMRPWEGFAGTYWLDPSDPLFAKLAARFLQLYAATYGPGRYYLADAFNEMVPPIADDGKDASGSAYGDSIANTPATRAAALPPAVRDARLSAYGERLYRSISEAVPGATWVMQGWLFGADKQFWTPDAIAAFLSKVPDDRMLVLDIGNDRYPGIWRNTKGFNGKAWAYGYVHNYGGSNPVYGDLDFYRSDITHLLSDPARGRLTAFGMFPEGLHSSSIVYDQSYDLAWGAGDATSDAWLARYLRARYGRADATLLAAWRQVIAGTYTTRYWAPRWWHDTAGAYLFFKRPMLDGDSFPAEPGDPMALRKGIDGLLSQARTLRSSGLFRHDLIDLVRHYASIRIDDDLRIAIRRYKAHDLAGGDAAVKRLRVTALHIDRLIGAQPETLASWVADARAYADTPTEAAAYVGDAKAQVTRWGGEGHLSDYASKAWQGLYADYYLQRWTLFLTRLRESASLGAALDEKAVRADILAWEDRWMADDRPIQRHVPRDPVGDAQALMTTLDPR